jgi:hypothetical protein
MYCNCASFQGECTKSAEQILIEQGAIIRQWPEFIQCTSDWTKQLRYTPACINLMERLSLLMSTELQVTYKPETVCFYFSTEKGDEAFL